MAYSLTCADTGANCPGSFTTESKDELLEHVQLHATHAHPEIVGNAEAAAMIPQLIKQV
jgi:predicted small metal-binding protein